MDYTKVLTTPIENTVIVVDQNTTVVVTQAGPAGPQGPPGPPGSSAGTSGTAGEIISSHKVLALIDGELFHADPTDLTHVSRVVGISLTSGAQGSEITYVPIGDAPGAVGLTLGTRYYLGLNGSLSASVKAVGAVFQQSIGVAKSTTILSVQIAPPIVL